MRKFYVFASLLLAVSVATFSTQALASTSPLQAPARVEATNSNMKILTLAEAQAITFNWTDAEGVRHTNSIADPATDPRHIVALLREIFINKKVPGIKKVGYSSANVELPDTGVVCYTITDAALDSKSWPGHSLTDRFEDNNDIRTIYDIPTPLEVKDAAGKVIGHYGDYTPDDEGYTTLLVKVKRNPTDASAFATTYDALVNGLSSDIEEVVLLTQGKYYAKGDGIAKTGALYKTSGTASSFYFISKGRARRVADTGRTWSFAPHFGLYEEYSPEDVNSSTQITDVWVKMKNGNDYKVQHDCGSVIDNSHQFNMAATYEEHSVNNMVFFIPDRRLENWSARDSYGSFNCYNPSYAPAVAMLSIPLKAAGTQNASEKNKWDITLTWSSNLNAATGNVIPQKFNLYIVDDAGNRTLLKQDFADAPDAQGNYHYTYTVDKEEKGRIIRYVVEGAPLEGEFTPVASNEDLVEVPGLDPNQRLQLGLNVRPVSDYRLNEQRNVYCNHLDVSNATGTYITETQLTKPNARMELYRHWTATDGKAQEALVATIYKFVKDGDKGYTYAMTHSNQDHLQKSAVYGPSDNSTHFVVATGSTDGKINFGKLEVWDQFSASTSQNQQPGRYTYDVRYLWDGIKTDKEANPYGVDYFYSTAVPVEVYKTTVGDNNQTFTAAQVEADHVLNTIDRGTLDSSKPAVTLSLEDDRDINYYKVYRLELDRNAYPSTEDKRAQDETGYANMSGSDRYDVFESGNFLNTVNTADGAKIADETAMQASDASTYARRMVPVIWTNRYSLDGTLDATAQNTYGAPIVTVQRVGVTAKLADGSSVETSNFAFSHNGVTGRYYKVPLSLQAIVPSTLRPVKYRIWRSTPDDVAMEGTDVAAYQKRLDQKGHPLTVNVDENGNMSFDASNAGETLQTAISETEDGQQKVWIPIADYFGARSVKENDGFDNFDVTYYVRIYCVPATTTAAKAAVASADATATPYYVAEAQLTVPVVGSNVVTSVTSVDASSQAQSVVYYSTTGQVSNVPFAGVNIKVTTYNDGHKTVKKLIVK
ncbi:hypothetical protein [Sodaliphilus pleomorphus]|uniref:Uncharacterized protein n=1 Tax=Sodaliphilus pleomorphus TaxID=2606626 RepID=A0A6L5XEZ3_9BACT|nr:hypothetical protein [Sodaliphilus pleomorphus]MSS18173.1 hypothetical protein [Sodaliphilus pleomorphus]